MIENYYEDLQKKLDDLDKKVEMYYDMLQCENELDFVLNGTYCLDTELENIWSGSYEV